MLMDIVLVIIGALVVTFCTVQGFGRSLMALIIFYITTIILGIVMLSVYSAQHLAERISSVVGGYPNQTLFETLFFLAILIPSTIGIFLLTHYAMDSLNFSRIQWLDTVLSMITGIILALCIMAILSNAWGMIVSTVWQPQQTWLTMRSAYTDSILRPQMQRVMAVYHALLFPFRLAAYPEVYSVH